MLALITVLVAATPGVPALVTATLAGALLGRSIHHALLAVRAEKDDRVDAADLAARYLAAAIFCALAAIRTM